VRSDSLRLGGAAGMNWARVVVLEGDLPVRAELMKSNVRPNMDASAPSLLLCVCVYYCST
jgi:hypothetical protein